ncbi:MAG: hypothetical protein COB02_09100 [Candidatus Cloacimonadota bacterium]|nr:MAG: hypothetical protein COB02_09100 [Candidatus Cloacimonadota bacterium]
MSNIEQIAILELNDFFSGDDSIRDKFIKSLGDSLKEYGFFAIGNHGVSQELIDKNYDLMKKFFALDDEIKNKYEISDYDGQRGFTSYGTEHAKGSEHGDLKEFWHVGREVSEDHELYKVYRKNIWIDEVPTYKEASLELMNQLDALAINLLRALAIYLGEKTDTFDKLVLDGNSIVRTIHYPEIPEDAEPDAIRAGAHEDINLITILCEATAPGLELLRRDGSWMSVHAQEGYLIVDSGDMLARVTNEVIPATTHRVVNPDNSRTKRYSMPYFVHPRPDSNLKCLDTCKSDKNPKKYDDISANDFLMQRLREIGLIS